VTSVLRLTRIAGRSGEATGEHFTHMLYTLFVVLLILWLLGFSFHVAGGLIHLILVVAVIVLVIQLLTGRRV
jgi:hypothetical protein